MNARTDIPVLTYSFAKTNSILLKPDANGTFTCFFSAQSPEAAFTEIVRLAGHGISFEELDPQRLASELEQHFSNQAVAAAQTDQANLDDLESLANTAASADDLLDQDESAPVVQLINALLLRAVKDGASDIHFETEEDRIVVRFRVDGILSDVLTPRRALAPMLASRIKVMGKLDIAEKRLPQDGRVSLRVGSYELDVRISTLPSQYGERLVLRLLDRGKMQLGVAHLGLGDTQAESFEKILARPDGLILVTGPTGSGKTTTLYAALDSLNDRSRNIVTVEDPIEYSLAGVGQVQVNPQVGLTFAKGLRAILRQDPDIIMVGEIRDSETARMAVESAMTGHLVLSTLHTNTAIGAVSRLIDMGVEPFLLAPMLRGVVAQRLVRRICNDCCVRQPVTASEQALFPNKLRLGETHFVGKGCNACGGMGYQGRIALYEVVVFDPELEQLVHANASEHDLTQLARIKSPDILEDGLSKMRAGLTSIVELARITADGIS